MADSEIVVAIIVALVSGTAVVSAAVLPVLLRMRRDNRDDHNRVIDALVALTKQVAVLERDLQHHVRWEESQKYMTADDLRVLVVADRAQMDRIESNTGGDAE